MDEDKKLFEKNEEGKKEFKKENWKTLFKINWKKDWLVLLLMVLVIFGGLAYTHDTKLCREIVNNPQDYCSTNPTTFIETINLTNITETVNINNSDTR